MYADEVSHLFEDEETCLSKGMFTYVSDDPSYLSRRCVLKCETTDKPLTYETDCVT